MKKKMLTVSVAALAVLISACGDADVKRTAPASQNQTVSALIEQTEKSEAEEPVAEEPAAELPEEKTVEETAIPAKAAAGEDVDIDLTKLSKTMVYSEVYNMMVSPEDYVGKTVRMSGIYNDFVDGVTGIQYFYCVIQDATACCAQGIEFVLTDDYKYPDDYPELGSMATVVGRFDTYMEGEYMYCTLRDAVLE